MDACSNYVRQDIARKLRILEMIAARYFLSPFLHLCVL